mmetsp:Transcript_42169/g.49273  ORF Transcript_42169/g.49273 Transcript_42169/m.49273 type:complete len:85 (+) Transcript_42169:367-621(+)
MLTTAPTRYRDDASELCSNLESSDNASTASETENGDALDNEGTVDTVTTLFSLVEDSRDEGTSSANTVFIYSWFSEKLGLNFES